MKVLMLTFGSLFFVMCIHGRIDLIANHQCSFKALRHIRALSINETRFDLSKKAGAKSTKEATEDNFAIQTIKFKDDVARALAPYFQFSYFAYVNPKNMGIEENACCKIKLVGGFLVQQLALENPTNHLHRQIDTYADIGIGLVIVPIGSMPRSPSPLLRTNGPSYVVAETNHYRYSRFYANDTLKAYAYSIKEDSPTLNLLSSISLRLAFSIEENSLVKDDKFVGDLGPLSVSMMECLERKSQRGTISMTQRMKYWDALIQKCNKPDVIEAFGILFAEGNEEDDVLLKEWERTQTAPDYHRLFPGNNLHHE